jgi:hypothetical protein
LEEVEKFKKMFISPDLTRKQQDTRELRRQLKLICDTGVTGAPIKNGKVIKTRHETKKLCNFSSKQNKKLQRG